MIYAQVPDAAVYHGRCHLENSDYLPFFGASIDEAQSQPGLIPPFSAANLARYVGRSEFNGSGSQKRWISATQLSFYENQR